MVIPCNDIKLDYYSGDLSPENADETSCDSPE